jgi:2-dehydro-3-deoxyphosphogluconate aldolase / (4S)-4-hydroxy-2-oxoglutarate aldolase
MTKKETYQRVLDAGIIAVIRAPSADKALAAAEAISAGGVFVLEVTMTVPGALDTIAALARMARNDLVVGAGTVLDQEAARRCLDAGAEFLVSPGFDRETVEFVRRHDRLMMSGALTPSEILEAWKAGSDLVKVFPCSAVGGAAYIKALKGPLPQIPLVPTGGVDLSNVADLFRAGASAVGVGGELVSAAALSTGNTSVITESAKKFVAAIREAREPAAMMAGK